MISTYSLVPVALVVFLFLFFAFFLFSYKDGNRTIKFLLGVFFLSLGATVADIYLLTSGFYLRHPPIAFILNSLIFILGPLCWLITRAATESNYSFTKKQLVHFIPFLLVVLLILFTYHLRDIDFKREFIERASKPSESSTLFSSLIFFLYTGCYLLFSLRRLRNYRLKLKQQLSDISKEKINWLGYILWWFCGMIGIALVMQIVSIVIGRSTLLNIIMGSLLMGMLIFIMSTIVKGLKNSITFVDEIDEKTLSKTSDYDEQELHRLDELMRNEQLFLDTSLTLNKLSTLFGERPRALSQLINNGSKQSFFDYVNGFRIEYFKSTMETSLDEKLTILEVMYASGFNSKSSFNTAFKKKCGITPSQWKKSILN